MKYLDSKPFNIAVSDATEHRPQVVENGGPATRIPDDAKCPSGRHNTRLTTCYCKSSLAIAKPQSGSEEVSGKSIGARFLPLPPAAFSGLKAFEDLYKQ